MSEQTNIAWCDATWNWARGCDKVSPGCKNCYIVTTVPFRTSGMKHGDPRVRAGEDTFNAPLRWNKKPWVCETCGYCSDDRRTKGGLLYCAKCKCFRHYHRRRVFSLSLGDWLDEKIPIQWLNDALLVMWQCQDLDFLLVSKRLQLWRERLSCVLDLEPSPDMETAGFSSWLINWLAGESPKNVWIIGSAENSEWMEKRTEDLNRIPAVVRGWSCEPLLGRLDFLRDSHPVDWVIFGGESGKDARPCNIDWIRQGNKQARTLFPGVKIFNKQLGSMPAETGHLLNKPIEHRILEVRHPKGGDPDEWPEDLKIFEWPASAPR